MNVLSTVGPNLKRICKALCQCKRVIIQCRRVTILISLLWSFSVIKSLEALQKVSYAESIALQIVKRTTICYGFRQRVLSSLKFQHVWLRHAKRKHVKVIKAACDQCVAKISVKTWRPKNISFCICHKHTWIIICRLLLHGQFQRFRSFIFLKLLWCNWWWKFSVFDVLSLNFKGNYPELQLVNGRDYICEWQDNLKCRLCIIIEIQLRDDISVNDCQSHM